MTKTIYVNSNKGMSLTRDAAIKLLRRCKQFSRHLNLNSSFITLKSSRKKCHTILTQDINGKLQCEQCSFWQFDDISLSEANVKKMSRESLDVLGKLLSCFHQEALKLANECIVYRLQKINKITEEVDLYRNLIEGKKSNAK